MLFHGLYALLPSRTYGKVNSAAAKANQLKTVQCEMCSTQFNYLLTRVGNSSNVSLFCGDSIHAQRVAIADAQSAAKRLVNRDVELVRCPSCGWVNQSTIQRYRKTHHRIWTPIALVLFGLSLIFTFFFFLITLAHYRTPTYAPEIFVPLILFFPPAVLAFFIQWFLRHRIDPNNLNKPTLPEGTPVALPDDVAMKVKAALDADIESFPETHSLTLRTTSIWTGDNHRSS